MATATSYTKAGVDAKAAPLATTAPLAPGTPSAGTSGSAARADHVHPVPAIFPGYPLVSAAGHYAMPVGRYTGTAMAANGALAPLTPLPVYRKMTLVGLTVSNRQAADAGTYSVALYATDATGVPTGAPLWVSPDTAATTAGTAVFTPGLVLDPGLYLLAFGGKGYTTTGPSPATPPAPAAGVMWMPTFAAASIAVSNKEGALVKEYDPATGTWPSSPTLEDVSSTSSIWWYAIQADPVL